MFRKVLVSKQEDRSYLIHAYYYQSIWVLSYLLNYGVFHYLECTLVLESIFAFDQSLRRLINFSIIDPRLRQEIKYHELPLDTKLWAKSMWYPVMKKWKRRWQLKKEDMSSWKHTSPAFLLANLLCFTSQDSSGRGDKNRKALERSLGER